MSGDSRFVFRSTLFGAFREHIQKWRHTGPWRRGFCILFITPSIVFNDYNFLSIYFQTRDINSDFPKWLTPRNPKFNISSE